MVKANHRLWYFEWLRYPVIFLLVLAALSNYAQQRKNTNNAVQKLTDLLNECDKLAIHREITLIDSGTSARRLAIKLNNKEAQAMSLIYMAMAERNFGRNAKAAELIFEAKAIAEKINSKSLTARSLLELGETYRSSTNLHLARLNLFKAINLYFTLADSKGIARCYDRLAANSFEIFIKLPVYFSLHSKELEPAIFLEELSEHPSAYSRYLITRHYINKALTYATKLKLDDVSISSGIIEAAFLNSCFENQKAKNAYLSVEKQIQQTGIDSDLSLMYTNLASLMYSDSLFNEAKSYAIKAYELSLPKKIKIYSIISSRILSRLYEREGNYREALKFMDIYSGEKNQFYASDIQFKVKAAQLNHEIELQESRIKTKKLELLIIILAFTLVFTATAVFIVVLVRKQKKQDELIKDLNRKNDIIEQQVTTLDKLNRERNRFFSILAHDLRNPIGGFYSITQIMESEYDLFDRADIMANLAIMSQSAGNLLNLLENLLDWSRVQNGIIKSTPESLEVKPLFDDCLKLLQHSAGLKNITLNHTCDINLFAIADKQMLSTILRNLVSNAIKFTPKGGNIHLKAVKTSPEKIRISVQDTGEGMSQQTISNLFIPDKTTKSKGTEGETGTGLGLILCNDFLLKHHSKFEVNSIEGKGSTFAFELDCASNC